MFTVIKKQPDSICVTLKDQLGSPYAIVSMQRSNIQESTYITTKGVLQLVFASRRMEGRDQMLWVDVERAHKNKDGSITGEPTGAFRQEKMFYTSEQPNLLDITEEAEIRRVWTWLDNGVSADELFKMRDEMLKTLEEFKKKKEAEALEHQKAEELRKETVGETVEKESQEALIRGIKAHGTPENKMKKV